MNGHDGLTTAVELEMGIREALVNLRGGLTNGPTDAVLNLMMDEAGWPTLGELALMGKSTREEVAW